MTKKITISKLHNGGTEIYLRIDGQFIFEKSLTIKNNSLEGNNYFSLKGVENLEHIEGIIKLFQTALEVIKNPSKEDKTIIFD